MTAGCSRRRRTGSGRRCPPAPPAGVSPSPRAGASVALEDVSFSVTNESDDRRDPAQHDAARGGRRVPVPPRPFGERQVHDPEPRRGPHEAHVRARAARGRRRHRPGPRPRRRVPGRGALPVAHAPEQRRVPAQAPGPRRRPRAPRAARSSCARCTSGASRSASRTSSRAACASAARSRARSPPTRPFS